jgi:hypothetical protein
MELCRSCGDADSGVGDGEMDGVRIGIAGFEFHLQGDFAFMGKLNGIPD